MNAGAVIYLDHAATTPPDARVAEAMQRCLADPDLQGNPSSQHAYGRAARAVVEEAREHVAALLNVAPRDVYFTSGATESNNLAILGYLRGLAARAAAPGEPAGARRRARGVISARIEHKSVVDAVRQAGREGYTVHWLSCDHEGLIDPAQLGAALCEEAALVSLMHVNNETGVAQDIGAYAAVCAARGVPLHVDAAQSAGKLELDVRAAPVSLLSLSAHKFGGPKGIGALYIAPGLRSTVQPLLFGGGQEHGLRSGTLPVHQIIGMGIAAQLARAERAADAERMATLRERLWQGIADLPGVRLNGHATRRAPGILNVTFAGIQGESLMAELIGLAVSTGAACDSDSGEPSFVLRALGLDSESAQSSVRFSLGRSSAAAEIDAAVIAVRRAVLRLAAIAP